jgi:hypothetical protein
MIPATMNVPDKLHVMATPAAPPAEACEQSSYKASSCKNRSVGRTTTVFQTFALQ